MSIVRFSGLRRDPQPKLQRVAPALRYSAYGIGGMEMMGTVMCVLSAILYRAVVRGLSSLTLQDLEDSELHAGAAAG